jgi:hypothetical protein
MPIEGVVLTQFNDSLQLMAQESSGIVDLRNSKSSAHELYQLLPSQCELNL